MTYRAPFGPMLGVPKERQHLCAIDGCTTEGKAQQCPTDGNRHFHGCVHYEAAGQELYEKYGLQLRPNGWGLLCDEHYVIVRAILRPDEQPPSPFCFGNPTKADCIKHGYCTRKPACDE